MRVIFLLHSTRMCGGVRVVLEMVTRLAARGHQAELWTPPTAPPSWFPRPVPWKTFHSLQELGLALKSVEGKKVATWWKTATWVKTCSRPGEGHYLVQDIETTYANSDAEARAVLGTYHFGLKHLATSQWVCRELLDTHGVPSIRVGLGIDFQALGPLPTIRDRWQMFGPCRRYSAGPRDLKGWNCLRDAALRAYAADPQVSLVTFSQEDSPPDAPAVPYTHLQHPSDSRLRALYSQCGVFVMPSNHEGFGLTAAEAMACGAPVVATDCEGNREFCLDDETALVVPKGDSQAVADACLNIMRDQALARGLAARGREFIRQYTWDACIDRLEHALCD